MKKIIAVIIVVAILAGIGGFFFGYNQRKESQTNEESQNTNISTNTNENELIKETPNDELPNETQEISENEVQNADEELINNEVEENISIDKKILYFYKNGFVGYIDNSGWNAPRDVQLKEIFDNDYYTLYSTDYIKTKANTIKVRCGWGLNGFRYNGQQFEQGDEIDKDSNFDKYATYSNGEYIFNLPNKLDDELSNEYTNGLPDIQASSVYVVNDKEDNALIAFNADYDLNFAKESKLDTIPQDINTFVINHVKSKGVKEDINLKLLKYYNVNLNNEGSDEEIYYIVSEDQYIRHTSNNNQDTSEMTMKNGGFAIILLRMNGTISVVDETIVSKEDAENGYWFAVGSFDFDVVDLNNDNIYEILLETFGYEFYWNDLIVYDGKTYSKIQPEKIYLKNN